MVPLPDVVGIEWGQCDIATCLTLFVEECLQETRAEPELLEVAVDSEKLDVAVIIFVTTDMADKKANKVAISCINAETSETILVLPGILEVTNRSGVEALCEDFTSRFEIRNF